MKLFYLKSELPKTELAPNYKYVILESQLNDTNLILLREEILNREKQITDGRDISKSRYRFFDKKFWHRPIIQSLENEIKEHVLKYLGYQLLNVPNELYIQAWVNVMRKEQAEHPIEAVGEKLRTLMPWIAEGKMVDKSKN